ncbi:hypothetical protein NQ318_010032 [Aromia moschata]|uniref:Uncharacterized protein n=1 Tax=Aromia moschata TaxID=1265417 RepID=A0AAV8Y8L3_9CUCU|nr:hypothetical protein NQ318_010032 [Aromia moschata]
MGISNEALVKIGALGGIATVTMGLLFKAKIQANVKATVYYKEAIESLRKHQEAVRLLGQPIKEGSIDIGNENRNYTKENVARYEVPVRGPKQKGIVYFLAERKGFEDNWIVTRIELELENSKKRVTIK